MKTAGLMAVGVLTVAVAVGTALGAAGGNQNVMPAYYDGNLFNITFVELPSGAEGKLIEHNGSINNIYQSDQCEGFISVLDAIQGDGFNPLWREVQITFSDPSACHQFYSDDEIQEAAAHGEITLTPTDEVYTCSVFVPK